MNFIWKLEKNVQPRVRMDIIIVSYITKMHLFISDLFFPAIFFFSWRFIIHCNMSAEYVLLWRIMPTCWIKRVPAHSEYRPP